MAITLAFDVYGTLINTDGVLVELKQLIGEKAEEFSQTWRNKQLEYSFRRGLMQNYVNFSVCTSHALDFSCSYYNVAISKNQKDKLLGIYSVLPVFSDVEDSLSNLHKANFRLFALSNGTANAVDKLLVTANIRDCFLGIISVDELKTFKPNPAIYKYFLKKSVSIANDAWLISSNPFDVIGAISAGMKAAWLKRSDDMLFDPWDIQPTITVKTLSELEKEIFYITK
ncbi:MAG: 2-haloacid dehalogenase [Gammaproteobacteria bacterium]|jgi:2-haloacid dehalogenase